MDSSGKQKLFKLSKPEAMVLKPLFRLGKSPISSLASGLTKESGGAFRSLEKEKIIQRTGKLINRANEWEITPAWQNEWQKYSQEITDILNTISQ